MNTASLSTDRRNSPRRSWRHEAILVCDNEGLVRMPVTVIDQSLGGVGITLSEDTEAPDRCILLLQHRIEPCRLVWQAGRLVGLQYVEQ